MTRQVHPRRPPRVPKGQVCLVQLDLMDVDGSAWLARGRPFLEKRNDVEAPCRQSCDGHRQPADLESIDRDSVVSGDLRNAVVDAQSSDLNRRLRPLPNDDVGEHEPGEEVAVELAYGKVTFEDSTRLPDDKVTGVVLEPGGVQKCEKAENQKKKGECPVKHDPARKPPQPHIYMLPRAGFGIAGTPNPQTSSNDSGMSTSNSAARVLPTDLSDSALVERIASGDQLAFEAVMRKYNGKLFRIARAILKDDSDAEDVLQDAYLDAYRHIGDFRGGSELATWLTRIVINQALMRVRKERRRSSIVPFRSALMHETDSPEAQVPDQQSESPSASVIRSETRRMLERRIDQLPVAFRTVFIMREVEEMSVEETARCLSITPATVRTRLFRARALLREALARDIDTATGDVFAFAGARCDRIVATVLARLNSTDPLAASTEQPVR